MTGLFIFLLVAAGVIACLFNLFLPTSGSLLAPTPTLTPTVTYTTTSTSPPTITLTPMSVQEYQATLQTYIATPFMQLAAYTYYVRRDLWEREAGTGYLIEDFESDAATFDEMVFPYTTQNGYYLEGDSPAQILGASGLLPSGNLLHFRNWDRGLRFNFPDGTSARAFGFDYRASEAWQLAFNDSRIPLSIGVPGFIGFVLYQNFPTHFTLIGPNTAQGGLSIDNISYIP